MKVSIGWLKELVDLNISIDELTRLMPLRTIGLKEVTENFIELDMKGYNRADLLSLRGVALEIAAITDSKIKFSDEGVIDKITQVSKDVPKLKGKVADGDLCSIYCVAKITGLRVGSSALEFVKKLNNSGMRAINNIADVTNLVMLEYGHPLHAFDASAVQNETINVRRAKNGEEITTLDGKLRKLTSEDIVLADEAKALDVAGVMGGKDTEITDKTTTILLSASLFNPQMIRKTSQKLKLTSEASKRFYHGLTKKRFYQALDAAIRMYQDLGGELEALTIVDNLEEKPKKIKLTQQKITSLIGIEIQPEQVEEYLKKLNFEVSRLHLKGAGSEVWEVTPPYFRLDIEIEEDLIEEIARMYGYENIPPLELRGELPKKIDQSLFELIRNLKNSLVELGLTEVQTYSFFSTAILNNFAPIKSGLVKVANPISAETEYLREDIWPNLVEVIDKNIRQGFEDIAIFEIGKIYAPGEKPTEEYRLSIALMNGSDNPIAELYKIFQSLKLHLPGVKLNLAQKRGEYEDKMFHPTRFSFLDNSAKQSIGGLAEVHPKHLDKFGISKRVAVIEISLSGF